MDCECIDCICVGVCVVAVLIVVGGQEGRESNGSKKSAGENNKEQLRIGERVAARWYLL